MKQDKLTNSLKENEYEKNVYFIGCHIVQSFNVCTVEPSRFTLEGHFCCG